MKNKIYEIVRNSIRGLLPVYQIDDIASKITEGLLANGAILPPCKVGDTVYWIADTDIDTGEPKLMVLEDDVPIKGILITKNDVYASTGNIEEVISQCDKIGENVYLSRELAEQALQHYLGYKYQLLP